MELLADGTQKNPVHAFCQSVISRHADNWPLEEPVLAQEFMDWFGCHSFLARDALKELCQSKGVNLSFAELPKELRGWNGSFGGKTEIVINERELAPGADLHTLFHEFRELLEYEFREIGHPTISPEDSIELRPELFAVACRMNGVTGEFPAYLRMAASVEKRWVRYIAYTCVGLFTAACVFSCIYTRQLEEIGYEGQQRSQEP